MNRPSTSSTGSSALERGEVGEQLLAVGVDQFPRLGTQFLALLLRILGKETQDAAFLPAAGE